MDLLVWILVGAIAGWLAGLITGQGSKGCGTNIVVGIVGSFIGGMLLKFIRDGEFSLAVAFTGFNISSIIVSTIGAIVLIGLLNLFKKD